MPTHRKGPDIEQDPIRLKNLLSRAEAMLADNGMRAPDITSFLEPALQLVSEEERGFWQTQSAGLAIFVTHDSFYTYRLPISFEELVVINRRFHIKPMLDMLSGDGIFYVLALSQGNVRLLRGTRYQVEEVELKGVPLSLEEAGEYEKTKAQLQFHSGAGSGGRAIYHSQGSQSEDSKIRARILSFFRDLEEGVRKIVARSDAPLILAGVDYIRAHYADVNRYSRLVEAGIDGNPEDMDNSKLHAKAWSIVEPIFKNDLEDAATRYKQLAGQGDSRAVDQLKPLLNAAYYERVDTLFIPKGIRYWGQYDPAQDHMVTHEEVKPGDEDLLDFAAAHTLLNGGHVYTIDREDLPGDTQVAAILRY